MSVRRLMIHNPVTPSVSTAVGGTKAISYGVTVAVKKRLNIIVKSQYAIHLFVRGSITQVRFPARNAMSLLSASLKSGMKEGAVLAGAGGGAVIISMAVWSSGCGGRVPFGVRLRWRVWFMPETLLQRDLSVDAWQAVNVSRKAVCCSR